jgi:glycosyltransferase 2 family protein
MLAVLLTRIHVRDLIPEHHPAALLWLVGALAVTLVGIVLSALRWQYVLRVLELRASLSTLLSHHLAGLFVGNFLPSTIGGDVLRVSRLSAGTGEPTASFASIVLERLTGWLVLPVITLFALATHPTLLHLGSASRLALALSVGTLVLLVGLLAVTASPRLGGRFREDAGWLRFAGAVHLGLVRFGRRPATSASVLLAGFAYQLAVVLAAWMTAHALGLHVGWAAILAFMPAVAIAQVLPISVGGLGVREAAFVVFLHPLGVSSGQAVALGLAIYGLNLTASLLGAPAFALGSRPARVAA